MIVDMRFFGVFWDYDFFCFGGTGTFFGGVLWINVYKNSKDFRVRIWWFG